jgi:hypothetical protein
MKIGMTMCEEFPSTLRPEELEAVHGGSRDNCVDADGKVPEHYGNYGNTGWAGYAAEISRKPCQREIYYNRDEMKGATKDEWNRLRAHEFAHTRGWDHGAGTPQTNPAYYPSI